MARWALAGVQAMTRWALSRWDMEDDSEPEPSVIVTLPASPVYDASRINLRNGLIGGRMSRQWWPFVQNGVTYGVDYTHQGSEANCVTGNASLTGATRINVVLSSGARTAAEVATATATALLVAGIDNVTLDGDQITIGNATPVAFETPTMEFRHESTRGMWGAQRTDFGAADLGSTAAVGATPAYHLVGPNFAHRIIGVYMLNTSGAADLRLGIATGPTYDPAPAAFSGGVEGISAIGTDGVRLLILPEPIYENALPDKWIVWRAAGGGNPTVAFRSHATNVQAIAALGVGRGDLPLNGPLLSSTVSSDPAVPIFTAGAYTHGSPVGGSPFNVYSAVGYIYEAEDANGDYYGAGNIDVGIGFHDVWNAGVDSAAGSREYATAPTLIGISETFRFFVPWASTPESISYVLAANISGEDGHGAIYDWTGLATNTAPVVGDAELLLDAGLLGAFGAQATFRAAFTGGDTSGTGDRAITFTPAVGDLLFLYISLSGNTQVAPTCSDTGGGTWTLVHQALWSLSLNNFAVFVRDQLVTSATEIIATVDTDTNDAGAIGVIAIAGMLVAGAAAIRSSGVQANQLITTTPAPVLNQNALTGDLTIAAVASGDTTTTPPGSWTERIETSQATPTTALEVCTRNSNFTGTTITFGATCGSVYASSAIELVNASARFNTYEYVGAPAVAANAILGISFWWGRVAGGPAGTITTLYDPPGAAGAYLSGWVDNGRAWSDLVDSGYGTRGGDSQYLTGAAGDMPFGDPNEVAPALFDAAASDSLPDNQYRILLEMTSPGITVVAA